MDVRWMDVYFQLLLSLTKLNVLQTCGKVKLFSIFFFHGIKYLDYLEIFFKDTAAPGHL